MDLRHRSAGLKTQSDPAYWEQLVLDPDPPVSHDMGMDGYAAADLDGDGNIELVAGGDGHLVWYRPATFEKGVIAQGRFHVGLALEDIDDDGKPEVVTAEYQPRGRLVWFKPPADLNREWKAHVIDPENRGCHDVVFADLDRDGKKELVTAAVTAGAVDIYKPGKDVTRPWQRHTVMTARQLREGTDAADVDHDGKVEIICGPSIFKCTGDDPFGDRWTELVYARDFRNMCRTAFADITGSGRPDILICESEYQEGKFSWFENRTTEDPDKPWVEHPIDYNLVFAHSLHVFACDNKGRVKVFVAEMAEGGWSAPRNPDARLLTYETKDRGAGWECTVLARGQGTHQAFFMDIDKDGEDEVVGKEWKRPQIHIFKKHPQAPALARFKHTFVDLDKPGTAIELVPCDVNGDGKTDLACGAWWYRAGDWQRFDIPGIEQVVQAADIDGDGRPELVCLDRSTKKEKDSYQRLSADLVWLKPRDPEAGKWNKYPVGQGQGDWPHGLIIAPVLAGNRPALVCAYHGAWSRPLYPELFEIPADPTSGPWPKRSLGDIRHSEEVAAADLTGNGLTDLLLGQYLLENKGDGTFNSRLLTDQVRAARVAAADINGDGKPDVVLAEQQPERMHGIIAPIGRLVWLENASGWKMRVIDHTLRWPHSLGTADLDGCGSPEIVVGEHDPTRPYRSRCRLLIYKKANPAATAWYRYVIDDRFEHHCGTKVFETQPGRWAIASHGWADSQFVHLWEKE